MNPTVVILSAAMTLRYLGEDEEVDRVERAVAEVVADLTK